jgi:hypothetical protein
MKERKPKSVGPHFSEAQVLELLTRCTKWVRTDCLMLLLSFMTYG